MINGCPAGGLHIVKMITLSAENFQINELQSHHF